VRTTCPKRYPSVTTVRTSNPTQNSRNYKYLKNVLRKIFLLRMMKNADNLNTYIVG
jgi:hypothetical protein